MKLFVTNVTAFLTVSHMFYSISCLSVILYSSLHQQPCTKGSCKSVYVEKPTTIHCLYSCCNHAFECHEFHAFEYLSIRLLLGKVSALCSHISVVQLIQCILYSSAYVTSRRLMINDIKFTEAAIRNVLKQSWLCHSSLFISPLPVNSRLCCEKRILLLLS